MRKPTNMKTSLGIIVLGLFAAPALGQPESQAPWGRAVWASHRDRVYAAEQFSNTVSVTDPMVASVNVV